MLLGSLLASAVIGSLSPSSEPQRPAGERITAPAPEGGRASGGSPPPPRLEQPATVGERNRPGELGLERLPDGGYRYVDPQRMFTMTVNPDGRAYFADRWRRPSPGNAQHGKLGRRPGASSFIGNPLLGGMAMQGPLEWLIRASGHDLSTNAKMTVLRETSAFRTDMAVAWTRGQVRKRLRELPAELLAVWRDDSIALQRRKEILFERWDECEDRLGLPTAGLPPDAVVEVDRMRREAGDQARRTIEAFVRRHLSDPAVGFSDHELAAFNTRRVSVATFDPHAEPEPSSSPGVAEPEPSQPASKPESREAQD